MECNKCFSIKYGHHPRAAILYIVDASDKQTNAYSKILSFSFPLLSVKIIKSSTGADCGHTSY